MDTQPPLPSGWTQYKTENGTAYYHHDLHGTTWNRPEAPSGAPNQPSAATKGLFGFEDGGSSIGDDFVSSISNFFGAGTDAKSVPNMEGKLRGGGDTPQKGFLARAMSLQKYFQLTGDEFTIRCTSVFTMIGGIFTQGGPSLIQAQMFTDKPDLYAALWVTIIGTVLLGFLPNLCESIVTGKKSDFTNYNSALVAFSLFPMSGFLSYCIGYISLKRSQSQALAPIEESMLSLPPLICITGYASIPAILSLPLLMINSWMFRILLLTICLAVSVGFLFVILRGSNESFLTMPSPRKAQWVTCASVILLAYLFIMLKLPMLEGSNAVGWTKGSMTQEDLLINDVTMMSQKVEELLETDNDAVEKLAAAVKLQLEEAEDAAAPGAADAVLAALVNVDEGADE